MAGESQHRYRTVWICRRFICTIVPEFAALERRLKELGVRPPPTLRTGRHSPSTG